MDLNGPGIRMSDILWHPVASCGALWRPVASCRAGLDPPNIQISDSGGLDLEAWMPGCWQDWRGLEKVTEVTARWGEGIGRNSHTLELQELGGYASVHSSGSAQSNIAKSFL